MRKLQFKVCKQRLLKQIGCDFTGLVAGSVGYLHAEFNFSSEEWEDCPVKIARFWFNGKEHAQRLDLTNACTIPPEVLIGESFEVSMLGAKPGGYRIETNKITIRQEVL